jgi:hypothetical protein
MILRRLLLGFIILLALVQLIRPARTNPPVNPGKTIDAHLTSDPAIADIFERSCKDCHTYRTVWPWYSSVAPVSWLVIHDVNEGRSKMNMSEWAGYDSAEARTLLSRMCREVSGDGMPIFAYKVIHRNAVLSDTDKKAICDWTQRVSR